MSRVSVPAKTFKIYATHADTSKGISHLKGFIKTNVIRNNYIGNWSRGADSKWDKEAADMGCHHQQMELPAQQTLGKTNNIVAHSSTTTDETMKDLFYPIKNKTGKSYIRKS
ncbi:hypothetical protein AVEN_174804-1 [Araneus ventricosus]|uniref:Uncharacterized protein n=1 Tax=Araneus ventricosus TaxID=182803 RepID=A0A4Y2M924_ARAVE|nr:hypothetical protein AVEN_89005-1 [Araneus ventricosus]GBN23581.1 hypothetical protein AVEN_174804-1 [Araneus ventricosus]